MKDRIAEIRQNIEAMWEKGVANQLCRDAEWLLAEVERLSKLPTWKPIGDAPKETDGLVFYDSEFGPCYAHRSFDRWETWQVDDFCAIEPTHYIELPCDGE